jgi:hypothetical protein
MAGAGQPWYMPLTWPFGHVFTAIQHSRNGATSKELNSSDSAEWYNDVPDASSSKNDQVEVTGGKTPIKRGGARRKRVTRKPTKKQGAASIAVPPPVATSELDLIGHLTSFAAASRSFLLAIFCIYFVHGGEDGFGYPAFGAAKQWSWNWMWPLVLRNVLATFLIAGFWDWFLYFSPLAPTLKPFKINPKYPGLSQIKHDAFVTTLATLCGSMVEIVLCHLWASGAVSMQRTISESKLYTLMWAITITHWRIPHFWCVHRMMHPWKKSWIPKWLDPGRVLYKHLHSLHHKSNNPTPFSGTKIHPLEATL